MKRLAFFALVFPFALLAAAPGPLTPAQALKSFQMEKGARIELVAAEPQVFDPVAMCFDEKKRMYVAESRGYPHLGDNPPKLGTVALLEDKDGDGRYEKRTTFAEGFTFPNGVMPWRDGIFLTCAPDIWFLKDTTGDGKADVRKVVLTGFGIKSSSEQLRVAHPTLGADGWVYITSGLTDANVTSPLHPERPAVAAKRQDGRFHPDTFVYEPLPGTGQFGLAFDQQGNRFVVSNRNPLMHVVLSPAILKRNPHFAFTETVENVVPVAGKVHPLSPDTTAATFHPSLINKQHSGTYTSACGICIQGKSAFICEPAQNLVQRQVLKPTGGSFSAEHPTPGHDFLASPDQWFRPVFSAVGPKGSLYLCDMYRKYVDHPRYLPEDVRGKLDFKAGDNKGRIWRVVQKDDAPVRPTPQARTAARKTLQFSRGKFPKTPPMPGLLKLAGSNDARVRFQAALQLGAVKDSQKTKALAQILMANSTEKWTRAAVFSSMGNQSVELLDELAKGRKAKRADIAPALAALGRIIAKSRTQKEINGVIVRHLAADFGWATSERVALLNGIAEKAKPKVTTLVAENPLAKKNVEAIFGIARASATRAKDASNLRVAGIEFLAHSTYEKEGQMLLKLLTPSQPNPIQLATVKSLGRLNNLKVATALMDKARWGGFAPDLREAVLGVVLSRSIYQPALIAALEEGTVPMHALSPARRRALERNKALGARAKKVFAKISGGDRMKVYEASKPILKMKANAKRGMAAFTKMCAMCHRHSGQGHALGPDLTGLANQPAQTLLLHILVPNHEVYGGYTLYELDTRDGQSFAGLLAAETLDNLTLRMPLGITKTLARKDVKTLRASPLSLMPNELEKAMTRQELADLIAFLKQAGQN